MNDTASVPAEPARPNPRPSLRARLGSLRWMGFPVAVFVFSRAGILFVTHWSLILDPRLHRPGPPLATPALEGLCRWDCGWFQTLAMEGYREEKLTNFFPLFPLAGRALHELTSLPIPICMVLAANLFSLAAYIVVYRLFVQLEGRESAQSALALLAAWPFSFFQAAGYPESIMTLCTAGSILLATRQRHISAGLVLGFGILGRHLAIVGGLALLAEQIRQRGWHPKRLILHPAFLGLFAPFAVVSVYLVFQHLRFGDAFAFLHARSKGWGDAAWFGLPHFFSGSFAGHIRSFVWLSLIPGVGAALLLTRQRWWTLAAFGLPLILLLWGIGLMGLGRYTGSMWPAFLPLGVLATRYPWLRLPAVTMFAMAQGLYLYLYVHSYEIN